MIALDTNVLVRFFVEDDRKQSRQAAELIQHTIEADDALFVSDIVLCELVWVLSACYKIEKPKIIELINNLLRAKHLTFQHQDNLSRALDQFDEGRGDFADYLIYQQARSAGCGHVATFDKALLKEPGFSEP